MPKVKCHTCGFPMKQAGWSGLWIHDWSNLSQIDTIEVEIAHQDASGRPEQEDLPLELL